VTLEGFWYGLFVAVIAGYLVLDGFDLGVGMLHPFAARSDEERRISLNSIGPIWDGNEVWLVVGGGVLFGAFPVVYASLFSGFYLALMLVLLFLILRTVSIEFRSKRTSPRWRATWDLFFSISSYALAILLGVAFGNVITGVPLGEHGQIHASLVDMLRPFPVWVGLTTVAMLLMHGSLYLRLKTDGEIQARVTRWSPRFIVAFATMGVVTVVWTYVDDHGLSANYDNVWPLIFPITAVLAFLTMVLSLRRGHEVRAFFASSVTLAMALASVATGLFPNMLKSTTDPSYSMTISNASAANETLTVMLVVAIIGLPFVILYTTGVQYLFRGKVQLSADSY
jgi:cytochrome bd ubiquinol oxidase subunit II